MSIQQLKPPPPKIINQVRDECKHLRTKIDLFICDNRLQAYYHDLMVTNFGTSYCSTNLSETLLKVVLKALQRKVNPNG